MRSSLSHNRSSRPGPSTIRRRDDFGLRTVIARAAVEVLIGHEGCDQRAPDVVDLRRAGCGVGSGCVETPAFTPGVAVVVGNDIVDGEAGFFGIFKDGTDAS